jgi:ParB-like chromosome segregation protein Spo0J
MLQIETSSLDRLIPHARNARTHSEDQVAQITGSIAEFGFVNPILVGADGVIVAGHGRVLAARKLGRTHQSVLVFVKGDPRRATEACGPVEFGEIESSPEPLTTAN